MARRTAAIAAALIGAVLSLVVVLATCANAGAQGADPARVTFASMDGRTKLVGYVFTPLLDLIWKPFDLAIGAIQAFIFALLTILYFDSAMSEAH